MAYLDELLRLGTPNLASQPNGAAVVQQHEGLLADLLKRLASNGVAFPGSDVVAQPPVQSEAGLPPLEQRDVRPAPAPGQPYQAVSAPQQSSPRSAQQNFFDEAPGRSSVSSDGPGLGEVLSALGHGYQKGGLIGGIGDAMRAGRSQSDQNQTVNWLMENGNMDQGTARLVARHPDILKSILGQRFGGGKVTDELAEYQFDVRQRMQRGEAPDQIPNFAQWKADLRRAGATQVNVNPGEKAFNQQMGKMGAESYGKIQAQAENARGMLGMYDLAEDAINTGVRTGILGDKELTVRQFGQMLGVDTDANKVAGGELLRSVQNKMALMMRSPDGGMGMPGALSDRDIQFLKDSQIGIDRSPEGNRRMLQAFRALEQRKLDVARLADEYVQQHGTFDQGGFNKIIREFADQNPLFNTQSPPPAGAGGDGYRVIGVR